MGDKEVVCIREHMKMYMVSPQAITVRIEWMGNIKKAARRPKGEISGVQTLCVGNRICQQSLGFSQ